MTKCLYKLNITFESILCQLYYGFLSIGHLEKEPQRDFGFSAVLESHTQDVMVRF
jgi:hypothetical protein